MSIDVPQRWSSSAYAAMILSRLKQKIAANRSGSLLKSVARRQKFIRLALKFTPLLSIALFLVGLVWLLLLPYEGYNKRTYISENALLPAQVNVYYGYEDIQTAERYRYEIANVQTEDSETRAKYIEKEFKGMGFTSAIQRFNLNHKNGSNAFAIYRAPRSDGKEALILSAPWKSRTDDYNTNGIAALLSLAKLFKKNIYWSKDIIFVVTDQGMAGMQSWIDAYHGTDEKDHALLSSIAMPRSGAIQGAVNLDFPGTHDYETLGLFFEGVNGQLPNLDLINTIVTIADRTARVPLILHDTNAHPFQDGPWSPYFESLFNMLRTMGYQALGHPSSDAGLYLRYKIDAVTVHGIVGSTRLDSLFGFHRIGILIESTFRSLNNLLEHFHQSFFFYLLANSRRYVSIGMYMPPVILLASGLILQSLVLYYFDPQSIQEIRKDAIPPAYSVRGRNLSYAFTVMTLTHVAGVVIFYIMQARSNQDHVYQFGISVSIATAVTFGGILLLARRSSVDARILKSFCLALSGLVITTISLLNFSLAAVTAMAVAIPYTIIQPTKQWVLRLLQLGLLAALSPPGIISILVTAKGVHLDEILSIVLADYHVVNSWLLLYVCVAYWPTNMAMQILIFSK